ncbi:FAD-dependent oxidoreductase [Clostridium sp. CMCC3677]|uniref:FAD-dependent oxidoreductase n=2 Tax=unclassified Clostridium TaxID=2614128 RepID=UPI0013F0083E|nr:FAD-dependent oxidoreductase [Clostridium sp. CMCC3677]NFG61715.1 dehydrogenase [Clostridium botulinum]NFQ08500.1 dehydrogenase [Clostridium botulinum]
MRIIVIGAVAAGTSAAAKARRNDDFAEIVIYERDKDISYSGCGLPYYIGGEIKELDELTPRNPSFFKKKYNIDVFTGYEVLNINSLEKNITVKNLHTNEVFKDTYDKLVLATGASPFMPNIKGIENKNVFFLRNVQSARNIKNFIINNKPKNAVIVGTGFIGFEMLENLIEEKINVTILEKANKITPNLDEDMAQYLENELKKKDVKIIKNTDISEISEKQVILADKTVLDSDMVIMATGVRPNVDLARECKIEIGITGAIKVDNRMETNIKDIYACGDCIETFSLITGKSIYRPLGSTANKTGRIAGDALTKGNLRYKGNLGTGIFKLFDMTIANTGLSEKEALEEGYEIQICHNIKPDKPSYFHGKEMVIKAIADKKTEKILGVQIIGYEGVDKRIDVFATLITYGAKVDELFHLDLAYAPPFSTTKDPVHYTGMILDNAINNSRPIITSNELKNLTENTEKFQIIDARVPKQYDEAHVYMAENMPHSTLRDDLDKLDKEITTVTYCNKGVTGNAAQNILINHGFKKVYNLSGGNKFYKESKIKKVNNK